MGKVKASRAVGAFGSRPDGRTVGPVVEPAGGRPRAGLDLSQGHFGTSVSASALRPPLPPVVTRRDCIEWLSLDDVQSEVFAAFVGARKLIERDSFSGDSADTVELKPGTVLREDDGTPHVDRDYFFGLLCDFVYWRLLRLAEGYGVSPSHDPERPPGIGSIRDRLEASGWRPYVSGDVLTIRNARELKQYVRALSAAQKRTPASGANTPGAMTTIQGANDDGTNCRP